MLATAIHSLFKLFVSCEEPCNVFLSYLNYIEFQVLVTLLTPHNIESKIPVSLCKTSSHDLHAELLHWIMDVEIILAIGRIYFPERVYSFELKCCFHVSSSVNINSENI